MKKMFKPKFNYTNDIILFTMYLNRLTQRSNGVRDAILKKFNKFLKDDRIILWMR